MNKNSLFKFIGKYKVKDTVNPEENYLTQIFAWILNEDSEYRENFFKFLTSVSNKFPFFKLKYNEFKTQFLVNIENTKKGYIDMIIQNEDYAIIFEHKIYSLVSENQIQKYVNSINKKYVFSILISFDEGQFTNEANLELTWKDIHNFTKEYLKNNKSILINEFEKFLQESDMNFDETFTIEELKNLWNTTNKLINIDKQEENYRKIVFKIYRLLNLINKELKNKKHTEVENKFEINNNINNFKNPNNILKRWGRIGIDLVSTQSTKWNPGVFVGVLVSNFDHKINITNIEKGIDFCFIFEENPNTAKKDSFVNSKNYYKIKENLEKLGKENYRILENESLKNKWRKLVYTVPLIEIIGEGNSWEEQYKNLRNFIIECINTIPDDSEISKNIKKNYKIKL